ncbi:MAG: DeoR/GlpR transcriptional regulator [Clostridiales bacterium]|nr:DeoR/GlpR transcriptional regulator [Clostridiales bacterium]
MFANERYNSIISSIESHGSVTVSELMKQFGVSVETIRRDLAYLEKHGMLRRVHGGAISVSDGSKVFDTLDKRVEENRELKCELSRAALELIHEDDSIAIDSGSTTNELAMLLRERFERLSIVTFSLDIIEMLRDKSGFRLIIPGGIYMPSERIFCGFYTEEALSRLHVSKSFIAPSSISERFGITINIDYFYNLQKAMMKISDRKVILADSTKFETASPIRLCGLDDIDTIITDSSLDDEIYRSYIRKNVNLIRA